MYHNAFDIKIISFGSGLTLVNVQHIKILLAADAADPPNEVCFKNTSNDA